MKENSRRRLLDALAALLRPLVRILLKHGVPYGSFAEVARHTYVDVAAREFGIPHRKQTVSRISVITGLTRKEVQHQLESEPVAETDSSENYHRAARVVSGWVREFSSENGEVADLPLEGQEASFAGLVKRYSGDMPVRAVLDELVHVGTVAHLPDGRYRLAARAYLPLAGDTENLGILLSRDVADLITTVDHNLTSPEREPFFQRKVEYDHLPAEALVPIKRLLAKQGQSLLERLDRFMAEHDRDANPDSSGSGRKRAMIGIYYFEDDFQSGEPSSPGQATRPGRHRPALDDE